MVNVKNNDTKESAKSPLLPTLLLTLPLSCRFSHILSQSFCIEVFFGSWVKQQQAEFHQVASAMKTRGITKRPIFIPLKVFMLHQPGKNDWSCIRNAYVMQPIKRYSTVSLDLFLAFLTSGYTQWLDCLSLEK